MNATTVDRWFDLLFPWHRASLIERIGGEVARQCRADLWRQVCRHLGGMSAAEIRGYVRAHATEMVTVETDWALSRHRLGPAYRPRVAEAGIEQVVAMIGRAARRLAAPQIDARPLAA
jgi:hypothetical protein